MAINTNPKRIRDYLPDFTSRVIGVVVCANVLIVLLIASMLVISDVLPISSPLLWGIVGTYLVLSISSSLICIDVISRPTKDLLAAVIHVANEPTSTTPPSPNDNRYRGTGFQTALQALYELASRDAISKPKSMAAAATKDTDFLKTALNQTSCGFVVLSSNRTITFSNKAVPVYTDPEGKQSLSLLFNGSDTLDAWLDQCDKESVRAEHIWTRIPDRLPEEDGRRLFDVIASYDKGTVGETVLTLIDRTSTYIVNEQELDFIAFAAHELRGPITVIRGYLDVLEEELDDVLKEDQHELFHRLTVSANRLSGYINNILNTSRYDRRHLRVHLSEDTVENIYTTIKDDMEMRASAQNRLLSINFPKDLPTIAADHASMSEVFGNLIDNAIKYSNEGGAINVTASVKGDFVEVSIQDFGIGMPGNVVSNLFQKFYRSHRSRETVAGTGIGLYISKAIVESHGGTISVRSEDGHGSTFMVDIPIYATIADKLQSGDGTNAILIGKGEGWITNHAMYRG